MNHQLELGYLRLEVADGAALDEFFTGVIGLAAGPATVGGDRTWTDDGAAQRVLAGEGPRNDLTALGFEAVDEGAWTATVDRLSSTGHQVTEADEATCTERRVDRMATVDAPWGSVVEVVLGLERTSAPHLPLMAGGFLTDGQGFGHAVIATTAFDESVRFAIDGLGMVQSDWLVTELAPDLELEVRFLHCNARHHTLALARAPFELPQKLHHMMFEVNDRDDVGRAFDRAFDAGLPLPNGLGRHDNDHMFSFYVASPAGFQVEVGHGARVIAEPWTEDRRYDRISAWGHQPVERPGAVATP